MGIDTQMQAFVVSLLQNRLPSHFSYHNAAHTLYVTEKAAEIALKENCTENEMRLIEAAALWHDVGCIISYKGHEEISCLYARQHLPGFGFSAADIEIVCGMIMATKIPQAPKNKLEEVVADADLEYLGTEKAAAMAEELHQELLHLHPLLTIHQWNQRQVAFLQKHHYFTACCQLEKEPAKQQYLQTLLNAAC